MSYLTKEELKGDLIDSGIPELVRYAEHYSNEIIKKHGDGKNSIKMDKAMKELKKLKNLNKIYEEYRPKTIFEDTFFTPEELNDYIEWQLSYVKDKYIPFGLRLPFPSLEDAHIWLKKESSKGVLSTERIKCPALENKDREICIGSLITMPYRIRLNNKEVMISDTVICNYSPFLIELNSTINSIKAYTGVDEISILNFFLCDISIEFPRIKASKADAFNQYITIQINANDVTKEEWDAIYDIYRINIGRKHKKRLSEKNIKLAEMLDAMEVPEKPNAEFYRHLIREWNKETGENMDINNWRTMRNRFNTVQKYKNEISTFNNPILNAMNRIKKED